MITLVNKQPRDLCVMDGDRKITIPPLSELAVETTNTFEDCLFVQAGWLEVVQPQAKKVKMKK